MISPPSGQSAPCTRASRHGNAANTEATTRSNGRRSTSSSTIRSAKPAPASCSRRGRSAIRFCVTAPARASPVALMNRPTNVAAGSNDAASNTAARAARNTRHASTMSDARGVVVCSRVAWAGVDVALKRWSMRSPAYQYPQESTTDTPAGTHLRAWARQPVASRRYWRRRALATRSVACRAAMGMTTRRD